MEITAINAKSPHLDDVIELGQANTATLGFLPRGAFTKHAADNQILVALEEEKVIGYLLYATSSRKRLAYIVHLCVERSHRGKDVATALFEELKTATKDTFLGIRVHCRRDYQASALWPKLGFAAMHEMPGRGKRGTTLTVWWFDHGHPTLFSYADEQRAESRLKVVIDANVFFELRDPPASSNEESQSLLADWLKENVELCITREILNEINRHSDKRKRKQGRIFAGTFSMLSSADDEFQKAIKNLRDYFPEELSTSDESDLRQLAWSISAGVQFFVTRDNKLLEKEQRIYDRFGVRIIRPADLVINQDELMRETEYQPVRLAGSQIKVERVHSGQNLILENTFRPPQGETKAEFLQRLHLCLADPRTFETSVVRSAARPLALVILGRQNQQELEIPILRVVRDPLSATLARHLVLHSVLVSSDERRILTKVTDPYLSDDVVDALREIGFVLTGDFWIKANLSIVETVEGLIPRLSSLGIDSPQVSQYFQQMADTLTTACSASNVRMMMQVERSLWPAKLTDIDIPAFVIPIQPEWAMHLFDPHIANQDLFGGEPSLIFNIENVYYRASYPKVLDAPARILWYVSKGSGKYQGTMAIRASSYLDEVVIDRPKTLFSQFRRLGIYQWEDVLGIAGGRTDQEIMAFRFSNTEVFHSPIGRNELKQIWMQDSSKSFHIQTPVAIPQGRFFRIYKVGVGIQER